MSSYVNVVDLSEEFTTFIEAIRLHGEPEERILSAIRGITKAAATSLELDEADVIIQGSFANGTAVEPFKGSYDVDLVLPCIAGGTGATNALDTVEDVFLKHGTYAEKVDDSNRSRCVRLNYADDEIGEFHVDVVPCLLYTSPSPRDRQKSRMPSSA